MSSIPEPLCAKGGFVVFALYSIVTKQYEWLALVVAYFYVCGYASDRQPNLGPIIEHGQKILNLLEQHIISSADKKSHLLVALATVDAGGNAIDLGRRFTIAD
jgi:hypothetical protein